MSSAVPSRSRRALPAAALLTLACVPLACVPPALAQTADDQNAGDLPTIVVSATGIPTPETEVASSVSIVTEQDIARNQQRTLPDVLQSLPGLNVVQTGGPGGTTSVFIRGTNSNHVKVLIDGIDAGNPAATNGAFDFG